MKINKIYNVLSLMAWLCVILHYQNQLSTHSLTAVFDFNIELIKNHFLNFVEITIAFVNNLTFVDFVNQSISFFYQVVQLFMSSLESFLQFHCVSTNVFNYQLITIVQTFGLGDIALALMARIKDPKSKSSPMLSFMQILSRLLIVFFIISSTQLCNTMLSLMSIVWGIADSIRYLYYLNNSGFVKFFRYNAFIILYPTGVTLELLAYYYADIGQWFVLIVLVYAICFPMLYGHMLRLRKIKME